MKNRRGWCELKLKFIVQHFRAVLLLPLRVRPHFSSIRGAMKTVYRKNSTNVVPSIEFQLPAPLQKKNNKFHHEIIISWKSSEWNPAWHPFPLSLSLPSFPFLPAQAFIPRKIISLLPSSYPACRDTDNKSPGMWVNERLGCQRT